jgi:hypothetical protein
MFLAKNGLVVLLPLLHSLKCCLDSATEPKSPTSRTGGKRFSHNVTSELTTKARLASDPSKIRQGGRACLLLSALVTCPFDTLLLPRSLVCPAPIRCWGVVPGHGTIMSITAGEVVVRAISSMGVEVVHCSPWPLGGCSFGVSFFKTQYRLQKMFYRGLGLTSRRHTGVCSCGLG